jgi:LemA protein
MPPIEIIVIAAVILLPVIWLIITYNNFVKLRFQCRNAWSNMDTELKRRYDLIPNVVETVKGYAHYERQVLQAVTEARAKAVASTGSPVSQAKDENILIAALRQLFGVVENYPDLKASQNFLKLQTQLVETEDRIQAARRFYNGNVRDLNTLVQSFPSNLIAGIFGFTNEEFFDIEEVSQREAPAVRI